MEIAVLSNLGWKWQPEICEKVFKKQAEIFIWDRPNVEKGFHLSVWNGEEDLEVTYIKQGFNLSLSIQLLKSYKVNEWGFRIEYHDVFTKKSRMNMGKILLWRQYNERKPPQITYKDNEEGKELQTFISSFQENMKNEVRVSPEVAIWAALESCGSAEGAEAGAQQAETLNRIVGVRNWRSV